jgi:hypothetical protein
MRHKPPSVASPFPYLGVDFTIEFQFHSIFLLAFLACSLERELLVVDVNLWFLKYKMKRSED